MSKWSVPVPDEIAHRRAGGRRHYNAVRRFRAALRQRQVAEMLLDQLTQAEIARRLRVHRATITRDVAALRAISVERGVCPCCGQRLNTADMALVRLLHLMSNEAIGKWDDASLPPARTR